jgi:hypothetical protein
VRRKARLLVMSIPPLLCRPMSPSPPSMYFQYAAAYWDDVVRVTLARFSKKDVAA